MKVGRKFVEYNGTLQNQTLGENFVGKMWSVSSLHQTSKNIREIVPPAGDSVTLYK